MIFISVGGNVVISSDLVDRLFLFQVVWIVGGVPSIRFSKSSREDIGIARYIQMKKYNIPSTV